MAHFEGELDQRGPGEACEERYRDEVGPGQRRGCWDAECSVCVQMTSEKHR